VQRGGPCACDWALHNADGHTPRIHALKQHLRTPEGADSNIKQYVCSLCSTALQRNFPPSSPPFHTSRSRCWVAPLTHGRTLNHPVQSAQLHCSAPLALNLPHQATPLVASTSVHHHPSSTHHCAACFAAWVHADQLWPLAVLRLCCYVQRVADAAAGGVRALCL
jgi:hypothetical protein